MAGVCSTFCRIYTQKNYQTNSPIISDIAMISHPVLSPCEQAKSDWVAMSSVFVASSGGNFGGVGGAIAPPPHLSSNCHFVGNFHFIGSSETHELFYKTVIISKFPTN